MKVICIGFGVVARTLIPLMLRLGLCSASEVTVICDEDDHLPLAQALGVSYCHVSITRDNHLQELGSRLQPHALLLNLSVGVSSPSLIKLAQAKGAMYLDTCVEPWAGGYQDLDPQKTTNAWLRRQALALRGAGKPVAVLAHGANPGLVSHFVKQALREMAFQQGGAALAGVVSAAQTSPRTWALLAQALDVRVVQVAERDTQGDEQLSAHPANDGKFTSTWSPEGLLAELGQPPECGWGSHETALPAGARLVDPAGASELYLPPARQQALQWVRSWVPSRGEQQALWVTHHEALSISALLSLQGPGPAVESSRCYRPTCYYAYRPCAHTLRGIQAWQACGRSRPPQLETLTLGSGLQGFDELGVLLCSPGLSCWYGSTLHARDALAFLHHPSCGNATSVQVAAGILGALAWMLKNPLAGVVEAEDMDHCEVLAEASPLLGQMRAVFTSWHPGGELQWKDFLTKKPTAAKSEDRFFFDDSSRRIHSESAKQMPR